MGRSTYLTFELAKELFAVDVIHVLEVIEQLQMTYIPNSPEHLLGIINFRGEILPVIDTSSKFSLLSASHETKKIIVFELSQNGNRYLISATVDGVKDVIEIDTNEIKDIPELGRQLNSQYLSGVIRRNDNFILLIEPEKVFSVSEAEVLQVNE